MTKNKSKPPKPHYVTVDVKVRLQAIATEDADGGFSVVVPALPGCCTEGDTIEEVQANIVDAAELWLDVAHDRNKDRKVLLLGMPPTHAEETGKGQSASLVKNRCDYNGYVGVFRVEIDEGIIRGAVVNIKDTITFQGKTVAEAIVEFRKSVDSYIEFCASVGDAPEEPES